MWPYHPDLLATPVPRYTSFPTAAEFSESVGPVEQEAALRNTEGEVSLYIHIPFCEKICWYCGCNTGAANRQERVVSYLEALKAEARLVSGLLGGKARAATVAFGGGSPNALSPVQFLRLVECLTVYFKAIETQWSVEFDPRALTADWESVLAGVGVTRASLGVQTFAPHLQQAIGRIQPDSLIERSVGILRRGGVRSLNFDLMYGLPGQTLGDLETSLARTVELGADRVALFGYAHVPHLFARQRRIDVSSLPGQPERFAMAEFGYRYLVNEGYVPVGFDHFALPGDPLAQAACAGRLRRNFQGFTEDTAETVIGLGASAISSFPSLIVQNEKNAGRYRMRLSQDRLAGAVGVRRSAEDRAMAALIEQLLCQGKARIEDRLSVIDLPSLREFTERGLVDISGADLLITKAGLPYARSIAALFDPYRQDAMRRFSSAI